MQVEIGIITQDGQFLAKPSDGYNGVLDVRRYTNKISGNLDPLIKRPDGMSFIHLSTVKQSGRIARIVGTNDYLELDTPIAELAKGEQ